MRNKDLSKNVLVARSRYNFLHGNALYLLCNKASRDYILEILVNSARLFDENHKYEGEPVSSPKRRERAVGSLNKNLRTGWWESP